MILSDCSLCIYQAHVFHLKFHYKHYETVVFVEYLGIYISRSLNCAHLFLIYYTCLLDTFCCQVQARAACSLAEVDTKTAAVVSVTRYPLLSVHLHGNTHMPTPKLHFQAQKSPKSGTLFNFQEHISKRIPTFMK